MMLSENLGQSNSLGCLESPANNSAFARKHRNSVSNEHEVSILSFSSGSLGIIKNIGTKDVIDRNYGVKEKLEKQ